MKLLAVLSIVAINGLLSTSRPTIGVQRIARSRLGGMQRPRQLLTRTVMLLRLVVLAVVKDFSVSVQGSVI